MNYYCNGIFCTVLQKTVTSTVFNSPFRFRTEFTLNQHITSESLTIAINNIEYKGGNTATGRALTFVTENMFTAESGSRQNGIFNIVIR